MEPTTCLATVDEAVRKEIERSLQEAIELRDTDPHAARYRLEHAERVLDNSLAIHSIARSDPQNPYKGLLDEIMEEWEYLNQK